MKRRDFLGTAVAGGAVLATASCAAITGARPRVVVVGGGFGGATAAKYLSMWAPEVDITLVERSRQFTSCPLSNLVLGGSLESSAIQLSYDALSRRVRIVHDEVIGLDLTSRKVRIARGGDLPYDKLILSPGIEFRTEAIQDYPAKDAQEPAVLHAWKAGTQTWMLRKRLEAMRDGGVFLLSIPLMPYRCPPGPYERACQVASYFKQHKRKSKVIILDANPDVTSKGALFKAAWKDLYPGLIEYRSGARVVAVDRRGTSAHLEVGSVPGDILNVVPPQQAGAVARSAGLVQKDGHWCEVDWRTMRSKAADHVFIVGDSALSAMGIPKSGHMANSQGKLCAASVIAELEGAKPPAPVLNNTCYSFVSSNEAIHVASVHQWDDAKAALLPVPGSGGLSTGRSEVEAGHAFNWAKNIWADMLS